MLFSQQAILDPDMGGPPITDVLAPEVLDPATADLALPGQRDEHTRFGQGSRDPPIERVLCQPGEFAPDGPGPSEHGNAPPTHHEGLQPGKARDPVGRYPWLILELPTGIAGP